MKHTSTPWAVGYSNNYGRNIYQETDEYNGIALVTKDEDAEHIVKCVNSHDALLEAAKSYVRTLEFLEKTLDADGMSQHMLKNLLIEKIKKAEGK